MSRVAGLPFFIMTHDAEGDFAVPDLHPESAESGCGVLARGAIASEEAIDADAMSLGGDTRDSAEIRLVAAADFDVHTKLRPHLANG